MSTPELGFEYFPSPEEDDDAERVAYMFLYLSEAVRKWPPFRGRLIKARLKTAQQCRHIEAHVIRVFRETRDVMLAAIENDDLESMKEPRLLERLKHAYALLALFADPGSLPAYRDMIFPPSGGCPAGRPEQADFNRSLWEGEWDTRDGPMPAQVTKESARRHRHRREKDGSYNSHQRLDSAAKAGAFQESVAEGSALLPEEQSERIQRAIELLVLKLRGIGKRAGLKPTQVKFLVEMAVHGRGQKDNPTAWKAIRERKRAALFPEIVGLVDSIRQLRKNILP
jgi:hypothetical protein